MSKDNWTRPVHQSKYVGTFFNRLNAQAQSKVISGGGATTKLDVYLASFLKKSGKVQTYRDKWFHKLNLY